MTTLEIICLYGLGISLCLLLFDAAGKTLRAAWRRNVRRYGVAASLIGLAVVCTINAQKPNPPVITVDSFLADAGSYATNDVLHVAVTNAPAYAGIDFSSCPVLVYARPRGLSDAPEWEELLPRRTFSELPADYAIEDATNYNYLVYLDYVPPSPVHTNGVFELRGFVVPGDEPGNLEQLAAGFINSRAILPPPTARDYVQDGLIAMWDGIENAGWGVHDQNATVWKDLTGNGYDLPLSTATLEILSNGVRRKNTVTHSTKSKVRWINTPSRTLEMCVTAPSSISSGSQVLLATTSVGSGTVVPCLVKKSVGYFEWSQQWNSSKIIFKSNITLTLSSSYNDGNTANGYVNGEVQAANNTDAWGFTADTISVLGDPRGTSYAPFEYCAHNVRVYNRALTAEEIAHNYKIDNERFNLP